jgi:hypothetical protein
MADGEYKAAAYLFGYADGLWKAAQEGDGKTATAR